MSIADFSPEEDTFAKVNAIPIHEWRKSYCRLKNEGYSLASVIHEDLSP